jgi:hypothetical protein
MLELDQREFVIQYQSKLADHENVIYKAWKQSGDMIKLSKILKKSFLIASKAFNNNDTV